MTSPAPLSLGAEAARKAVHLATALVPIAWGLQWVPASSVRWALGVATAVALLVEMARRHPAFEAWFRGMVGALLRPREHAALTGATWLAFGMWIVAMLAPEPAAVAALWAAAVGDASAALVGRLTARWRPPSERGRKSLLGSLACAAATAPGVAWLTDASWTIAILVGVVAALAERPTRPGDDNLRVVTACAIAAVLLGLR